MESLDPRGVSASVNEDNPPSLRGLRREALLGSAISPLSPVTIPRPGPGSSRQLLSGHEQPLAGGTLPRRMHVMTRHTHA